MTSPAASAADASISEASDAAAKVRAGRLMFRPFRSARDEPLGLGEPGLHRSVAVELAVHLPCSSRTRSPCSPSCNPHRRSAPCDRTLCRPLPRHRPRRGAVTSRVRGSSGCMYSARTLRVSRSGSSVMNTGVLLFLSGKPSRAGPLVRLARAAHRHAPQLGFRSFLLLASLPRVPRLILKPLEVLGKRRSDARAFSPCFVAPSS